MNHLECNRCRELEAENKMLRERAASAVAQEQLSRNEANRLRAELQKCQSLLTSAATQKTL